MSASTEALLREIVAAGWTTDDERDALLGRLTQTPLAPADARTLALHADPAVSELGAATFAATAPAKEVRALVLDMNDRTTAERERLAAVARRIQPALMRQVLDAMLAEESPLSRRLAWDTAVSLTGPLWRHYLKRAVLSAPAAMRIKALQLVIDDRGAAALTPFLLRLADDEDERVALASLEALAGVEDERVLEIMLVRFATRQGREREIAGDYLKREAWANPGTVRKTMLQILTHGDAALSKAASQILFTSGKPAVVVQEALAFCSGLLGWLRERVMNGLRSGGAEVLESAMRLLHHDDESIRFYALTLCEGFEDERLLEPFCALLEDPDWWLRVTVCDSLARLGDERAVPHLVRALSDEDVRWAAIDSLGRLGSVEAMKPLISMLRDKRPEVRLEVLQGLSRLEDERLLPVLEHVRQNDEAIEVRRRAHELLRRLSISLGIEEAAGGMALRSYKDFDIPLERMLAQVRELGASDLHISPGDCPAARIAGELRQVGKRKLTPQAAEELVFSVLHDEAAERARRSGELDFSHVLADVGRYRCSIFRQARGWAGAYRVLPNEAPTLSALGIPRQLNDVLKYHQGIIVVSGPAGSGKSSSLAAFVNLINETKPVHVVSLEDPIEYVHTSKLALVNQRQIGLHTETYLKGLRASLREDPDVIVIGEMRDRETIRLALQAAETGHLVLGTLDTRTAVQAVDRLIGAFSPSEQEQVRRALSESLKFVISQVLLPRLGGGGRVAAFEVLRMLPSIANLVRKGETFQIPGLMQLGKELGLQTRDDSLMELVRRRVVAAESAWLHAEKTDLFAPLCDPEWLSQQEIL